MKVKSKFILVIHDAIRIGRHWDLRFKMPESNTWVSFSCRKEPILSMGQRLYIVRTHDHSEKEALTLEPIPEGKYGAGTYTLVDQGDCDILLYKDKPQLYHVVIDFKGSKLKGPHHFLNTGVFKNKSDYKKRIFAFFKAKNIDNLKEIKNIDKFLNILEERLKGIDRKPSPTIAWEIVYNNKMKEWRGGRYPYQHKTKIWNGMSVDYNLKDKWLNDLNNIKEIEIRGSCEGHDKDWVSYIAFRFKDSKYENKDYIENFVKKMKKHPNTFCDWDIGMEKRPRIVCATNLLFSENKKEWEEWWNSLSDRIKKSL